MPAISNICSAICASKIKASMMTQSQSDWGDLNSGFSTTYKFLAKFFPQTTFIFSSLAHLFSSGFSLPESDSGNLMPISVCGGRNDEDVISPGPSVSPRAPLRFVSLNVST